jgi:hypothetical protein
MLDGIREAPMVAGIPGLAEEATVSHGNLARGLPPLRGVR